MKNYIKTKTKTGLCFVYIVYISVFWVCTSKVQEKYKVGAIWNC